MKPTKNRIFCHECQRPKMLFETEKKALLFMKFNNEEIAAENEKVPARAYFCEACGGWHITHFIDPQRNKSRTQKVIEYMHSQQAKQKEIKQANAEARKKMLEEQSRIREETQSYVQKQLLLVEDKIQGGCIDEAISLLRDLLELSKTKYIANKTLKKIRAKFQFINSQRILSCTDAANKSNNEKK